MVQSRISGYEATGCAKIAKTFTVGRRKLPFETEGVVSRSSNKRRRTVGEFASEDNDDEEVSFHEFRASMVKKYPNLAWLGPTSMAVYWYRMYLKDSGWIRCNAFDDDDTDTKKRSRRGGQFFHIPPQYVKRNPTLTSKDIIQLGNPGTHYANSYISLYNMIRKYGYFERSECFMPSGEFEIRLTNYKGPDLPAQQEFFN